MINAEAWAHMRMGALTTIPPLNTLEERARNGSFADFVRMVQDDAVQVPSGSVEQALADVQAELLTSMAAFKPLNSAHEAYAVLLEEVDELWDEVKKKQSKRDWAKMEREAIQVAAMAVRMLVDVIRDQKRGHEEHIITVKRKCVRCDTVYAMDLTKCPRCSEPSSTIKLKERTYMDGVQDVHSHLTPERISEILAAGAVSDRLKEAVSSPADPLNAFSSLKMCVFCGLPGATKKRDNGTWIHEGTCPTVQP